MFHSTVHHSFSVTAMATKAYLNKRHPPQTPVNWQQITNSVYKSGFFYPYHQSSSLLHSSLALLRNLTPRVTQSFNPSDCVTSLASVYVEGYLSSDCILIALIQRAITTFKPLTKEFQVKKVRARNLIFHNTLMSISQAQPIAFLILDIKFAKFDVIMKIPLKACSQGERLRPYPLSNFVVVFTPRPFSFF